jgi:hypothetical protein
MAEAIASMVRMIEADAGNVGALSTGEAIAAALIFNRMDWLPPGLSASFSMPSTSGDRNG